MTTATSKKKIASNRANASHSTGPKTEAGKSRVRLNALRHGFRAEDLVLPAEDARQFEAFRQAWHDDWKPCNQVRFQLVEQLVADSWRLRRCVRVETLQIGGRAELAITVHNNEVQTRLAKGRRLLDSIDPTMGLKLLDHDRPGIESQIKLWLDLAGSATSVEHWWNPKDQHGRLLTLLGFYQGADAQASGGVAIASWKLLVYNDPTVGDYINAPLDDAGAAELFEALAEFMQDQVATLRQRLEGIASDEVLNERISDLATFEDTPEGRAALRYEGQHDRSFRATLNQLVKLIQTGVDLVPEPELDTPTEVLAEPESVPIKANEESAPALETPIKATARPSQSKKQRRSRRDRRSEEAGRVREQPRIVI
jgi:hypothetical protein